MQKSRVQDLVIGLITIALGAFLWSYTPEFSEHTQSYSRLVLTIFIGLGVILSVISLINAKKPAGKEVKVKEFKNPMIMYLIMVIYVAMIVILGFFPASIIFMPAVMLFMGYRKPLPMICVTVGMLGFLWWLFVITLKVRLPQGADFMSFMKFLYY